MSNRSRRAELKALADAREREAALATNRHIDAEVLYSGVGQLLVRLAHVPPFDPASLWEVRRRDDGLIAYQSHGTEPGSPHVTGHTVIDVPQHSLELAIGRFESLAIPLVPSPAEFGIADADCYVATITMGFATSCRLAWCADAEPAGWSDVVRMLLDLGNLLEAAT